MIHHTCLRTPNEDGGLLCEGTDSTMTVAGMGYDGRYRCAECKRRVDMDEPASGETWRKDWLHQPRIEPPYPEGWC